MLLHGFNNAVETPIATVIGAVAEMVAMAINLSKDIEK